MVLGAWLRRADVAGEGIEGALPAMPAVKAHFRALPYREVAGARSGEARGARWSEIDTEAREWRIPGDRTKTGAPHRVPLSPETMAVLERARALNDRSGLMFPGRQRGRELSNMTLTKILRQRGLRTGRPSTDSALPSATGVRRRARREKSRRLR